MGELPVAAMTHFPFTICLRSSTQIVANNYHILYLSARAIGQASITKDYLTTIRQGEVNLPDGEFSAILVASDFSNEN